MFFFPSFIDGLKELYLTQSKAKTFKLLGVTYLIAKIKFKVFYVMVRNG